MFEQLFRSAQTRHRHARGPFSCQFERHTDWMWRQGYRRGTVASYLYSWEAITRSLIRRRLALKDLSENLVVEFLSRQQHVRSIRGRRSMPKWRVALHHRALRMLLSRLYLEGTVARPSSDSGPRPWYADRLDQYLAFLRTHRGLREVTTVRHRREARLFFESLGASSWDEALGRIRPQTIDAFLISRSKSLGVAARKNPSSVLRGLFRFLYLKQELGEDLSVHVSRPRLYSQSGLPSALPWTDVRKVLQSLDRGSPRGCRAYAMLLMLATYGLRGGEVARLKLDDVDWRRGCLRIQRSKSGRITEMPLTPQIGNAIIAYLRRGRPKSEHRELFLTIPAPHVPYRGGGCSIYYTVRKHLKRAGIQAKRWGSHTLRHSYAAHLLRSGCSFKAIGDILGHRDPQSTFIYAKLGVEDLREVGLEVPEVAR